jgi:predicted nucleic acid-binding protein
VKIASKARVRAAPALLAPLYLDASALGKLYMAEPESDSLNRALRGRRDLHVSDLAITEIVSALARRRREGLLPADVPPRLHATILAHLESGLFHRVELIAEVHREAERLLLTLEVPVRAADSLHLALALAAGARTFVTYDRRQAAAARRSGLNIWPGD